MVQPQDFIPSPDNDAYGLKAYLRLNDEKERRHPFVNYYDFDDDGRMTDRLSCKIPKSSRKTLQDCEEGEQGVISCMITDMFDSRFCVHTFHENGVTYGVVSENKYLADWKKHRQNTIKFLEKFAIAE